MDFFDGQHYRLNKRLLYYVGQWPLQSPNTRNFYRTLTVLVVESLMLPQLIRFAECMGDLKGLVECLPMLLLNILSTVKFVNSCVQASKMRMLINRIKDNWTVRASEFDEELLITYAERGRLLTVIYTTYILTSMVLYFSVPLIPIFLDLVAPLNHTRDRIFIVQTEYFFDREEKYFYVTLHTYFSLTIIIFVLIAYDTMYAVYVQHACCIFATAGARLQNIKGIANDEKLEMYNDPVGRKDEAYDDIVACIKMHREGIEITKVIESANYMSSLFVTGTAMLMTTMSGFMTVTNLDRPSEAVQFALTVLGEMVNLFYLCWQGQVLIEHSEDIYMNAYNVEWYDISPRAKKLLILIMRRSFEPCRLTAGKVFVLSMENFAATLKTSMSYFTVLLSTQ